MKKETSLCFSGHRAEKLPKTPTELQALKERIWEEVDKAISEGIDTFYMGGCYGFDLLCADTVLLRARIIKRGDPKQIKLIACVPYKTQWDRWSKDNRNLYFEILGKCDDVITLSTHYHKNCYKERNQYMVDRSSRVIAYCNSGLRSGTAQTIRMAERQNLTIINLYER